MRIYFKSMVLPKKAAKRIHKDHSHWPLNSAQLLLAHMLGYQDWHDLEEEVKAQRHEPSKLDEEVSRQVEEERITFQASILARAFPYTEPVLRGMALRYRVSSANPTSDRLNFDGYRKNHLIYWEPVNESPEWRFIPSQRAIQKLDQVDLLDEKWTSQNLNFGRFKEELDKLINEVPESVTAYVAIISAIVYLQQWSLLVPYIENLEKVILETIPGNYPKDMKVPSVNWYTIQNRDYLRSIYFLALGFYAVGRYKKAKKWFVFLGNCTDFELGQEKAFLDDLNSSSPEGNVHLSSYSDETY